MPLKLVRRKEPQGEWVRETVCLGILVNPSQWCVCMNVCMYVYLCVCTEAKRKSENRQKE